jgi:hypothetical protein
MELVKDFKQKILGLYHNRIQAYTYPRDWAHIFIEFSELDENRIFSKSWYAIESSFNPYKEVILDLYNCDDKVVVKTSDKNNHPIFDIDFYYIDQYWIGENCRGEVKNKNIYISTSVKFDGKNYFSRDSGHDINTGEFLWGKMKHEGMFHFIKD